MSERDGSPITIEILYLEGCPNHQELVKRLPCLLKREGIDAEVKLRPVKDAEDAKREDFLARPLSASTAATLSPGLPSVAIMA